MNQILFLLTMSTSTAYAGEIIMNYKEYDGHDNYWAVTPEVVICKNQTIFTKDQVKHAIKLWGEKYAKITMKEKCSYESEYGKIKITDGKHLELDEWGYTSYLYRDVKINNKTVRAHESALVQLDRNVNDITLLVHEIGHAYGYNHYEHKEDVMNAYYEYEKTEKYPY